MPQPFNSAVITDEGTALLNKATAGEATIQFTRMVVGDGSYTDDDKEISNLQTMTALKSQRNSYALSGVEITSDNIVKVTALIANQDPVTLEALVTAGYYINEIGVYAMDAGVGESTEVLYSIAVTSGDNGDFMPPFSGANVAQITQDYYLTVNNGADVAITAAGAAMLAETANALFEEYAAEIETINSTLANKVDVETDKGLSANDFTDDYKAKLDGIESGAQANTVTGVKGNAESSYRTGNINLTPTNIGALATSGGAISGDLTVSGTFTTSEFDVTDDTTGTSYRLGIDNGLIYCEEV